MYYVLLLRIFLSKILIIFSTNLIFRSLKKTENIYYWRRALHYHARSNIFQENHYRCKTTIFAVSAKQRGRPQPADE